MRYRHHHLLLLLLPCLAVLSVAPAPASGAAGGLAREEGGPSHRLRPCADDACPVCCAAWQVGLSMVPMRRPESTRCVPEVHAAVIGPRGFVRAADVRAVRVALILDEPDRMDLVFEVEGQVDSVYRLAYRPTYVDETTPLGPALRRVLARPDQCVRVRLEGDGRTWAEASFRVTAPDPGLDAWLAGLDEALAGRPAFVRELVRARALLAAGYDLAALGAAEAVLARDPREPHAAALVQVAVERLGLHASDLRVVTEIRVFDLLDEDPASHPEDCRAWQVDAADRAWDLAPPPIGC